MGSPAPEASRSQTSLERTAARYYSEDQPASRACPPRRRNASALHGARRARAKYSICDPTSAPGMRRPPTRPQQRAEICRGRGTCRGPNQHRTTRRSGPTGPSPPLQQPGPSSVLGLELGTRLFRADHMGWVGDGQLPRPPSLMLGDQHPVMVNADTVEACRDVDDGRSSSDRRSNRC